jgi:hypothetical protein
VLSLAHGLLSFFAFYGDDEVVSVDVECCFDAHVLTLFQVALSAFLISRSMV